MKKEEPGRIHIYCGDGKGKTTAALGLALRAAGRGRKVLISRFLKTEDSGDVPVLRNIPGIEVMPCQKTFGFTFQMSLEEKEEAGLYYTEQFQKALKLAEDADLLILDEIGRGTSTFDGLSIAWAVVEHVSNTRLLGAKTLFATHYHELTELEGTIAGVKNYCIAVKEQGDDIVFLRKIVRGGADKSYGIQVAKLAGVPESVIARAKEIAQELTEADITAKAKEIAQVSSNITQRKAVPKPDEVDMQQLTFFDTVKDDDVIRELGELEINTMSPMDALNTLYRLQNKLKNRWKE